MSSSRNVSMFHCKPFDSDHTYAIMDFENGGLGSLEGSRCGVYGHDIRAEIIGNKETIQVGYLKRTPVVLMTQKGVTHDTLHGFMERFGDAYVEQLRETIEDGRTALLVSLAATQSHRLGRPIPVTEVDVTPNFNV